LDIEVAGPQNVSFLKEKINPQLPSGIAVTCVEEIALSRRRERLKESHFLITLNGVRLREQNLRGFLESDYFPVAKTNKKGTHEINARAQVKTMRLISPNKIELSLYHTSGPESKPAEIIKGVFSLNESQINCMKILKTNQILE
jgi:hypothetical protein